MISKCQCVGAAAVNTNSSEMLWLPHVSLVVSYSEKEAQTPTVTLFTGPIAELGAEASGMSIPLAELGAKASGMSVPFAELGAKASGRPAEV